MFRHAIDNDGESPIERKLLELVAHIDAATQRMLTLIRAYDESGDWRGVGIASCAHWLAWRCGMTPATARERLRVARALGDLPKVDEAFSKGLLSYSKVRAMTRVATPDHEAKLVHTAKTATAAQLEVICRGLRSTRRLRPRGTEGGSATQSCRADGDRGTEAGSDSKTLVERWVIQKRGDGDLVRVEAQLHPDEAALVMKALDALRDGSAMAI